MKITKIACFINTLALVLLSSPSFAQDDLVTFSKDPQSDDIIISIQNSDRFSVPTMINLAMCDAPGVQNSNSVDTGQCVGKKITLFRGNGGSSVSFQVSPSNYVFTQNTFESWLVLKSDVAQELMTYIAYVANPQSPHYDKNFEAYSSNSFSSASGPSISCKADLKTGASCILTLSSNTHGASSYKGNQDTEMRVYFVETSNEEPIREQTAILLLQKNQSSGMYDMDFMFCTTQPKATDDLVAFFKNACWDIIGRFTQNRFFEETQSYAIISPPYLSGPLSDPLPEENVTFSLKNPDLLTHSSIPPKNSTRWKSETTHYTFFKSVHFQYPTIDDSTVGVLSGRHFLN